MYTDWFSVSVCMCVKCVWGVCVGVRVWLLHMQITLRSDFTDFAAAAVQKT